MIKVYDFLTEGESKLLSDYILETESDVKSLGEDIYPGTSNDSLTGRYTIHNYLNYFPGKILIPKLKSIFKEGVIQCWANTFRKGEGIEPHEHGEGFLSANVFLSGDPDIGTFYENEKIKNEIGKLIVFPSEITHHVNPNPSDVIRVSMAFDIYPISAMERTEFHNKFRFYTMK